MRVSQNGRSFVDDDGVPFFYLADTAWGLLHTPTREEIAHYLQVRRDQGFTVIMPVAVWRLEYEEGHHARPFIDGDPTRPHEPFWQHVDWVIETANDLGLLIALLPSWGNYVAPAPHAVITPQNARAYGHFLGRRYRDRRVIWVLGGDRNPPTTNALDIPAWRLAGWGRGNQSPGDDDRYVASWLAMAEGLAEGDGGRNLMTFHPTGVHSSAEWFPDAPWLDFHLWQTSTRLEIDYCRSLLEDYTRTPVKPFLDGETRYEHSHQFFSFRSQGHAGVRMTPRRVRQAAYYALLCGAAGHTYGCRDVWSFYAPDGRQRDWDVDTHWREALRFPAAEQMPHLRSLFAEYPWHRLVPEQGEGLIVRGRGEGNLRVQAAVADDGSFALAYVPEPMDLVVDVGRLPAPVAIQWFDPVTGAVTPVKRRDSGSRVWLREHSSTDGDAVLVLRGA